MKRENLPEVLRIHAKLNEIEETLEQLNSPECTVIINTYEDRGRIMTIRADVHYEHQYTPLAISFITSIKQDLETGKVELLQQLEKL